MRIPDSARRAALLIALGVCALAGGGCGSDKPPTGSSVAEDNKAEQEQQRQAMEDYARSYKKQP